MKRKTLGLGEIVSIILAVAGILTTIFVYMRERPTKSLQVMVVSNASLVSVKDEFRGRIQIIYEGKQIRDLSLIRVQLQNTGNVPIQKQDYDEPIRLSISEQGQIINARIPEVGPKNVKMNIVTTSPYQIELTKSLLNPGDWVILELVCANNDEGVFNVDGRIVGVHQIEKIPLPSGRPFPIPITTLSLATFGCFCIGYGLALFRRGRIRWNGWEFLFSLGWLMLGTIAIGLVIEILIQYQSWH